MIGIGGAAACLAAVAAGFAAAFLAVAATFLAGSVVGVFFVAAMPSRPPGV